MAPRLSQFMGGGTPCSWSTITRTQGTDTESFKADVVSFAGFMYYTGLESSTRFPGMEYEAFSEYRAEYASLLAVTAPLPALRLLLLLWGLVRRRPIAGRCPQCRYDLTGNVSGVCPECGREITAKGTAV